LAYRRLFAALGDKGDFVYPAELQAWEKSLNAAKNAVRPGWRTIGFQHGSILGNLFNYFHSPAETAETGPSALPLPDVFGTDGEVPESLLSACGYRNLTRLEALRYVPLAKALAAPVKPRGRTILVAGSIDPVEAARLAEVVTKAFPRDSGFRVVFKGHPMTPFKAGGYEVAQGSLAELLAEPGVMISASSGAALEALAYGWRIVVPLFADVMPMSPLSVEPSLARFVEGPEELRAAVEAALADPADPEAGRNFVRRYWDLDAALPRWKALFGI
jgi:surface carbohydrate biosynthesis protein (TIGR04326 family)